MKTPSFTKEQIEYLNALHPEKTPEKTMTDREIWIAVGERKLVRHLNWVYDQQLQKAMI